MDEEIRNSEKTKENGDKQSIRYRVQNTVYRMLKEFNKDLSSIKKTETEKKDTLTE